MQRSDTEFSFEWKGGMRRIPQEGDSILAEAPDPVFALEKCRQLWSLGHGVEDEDSYVYAGDAAVVGAKSTVASFSKLQELQRWCKQEGLVDLSTITVSLKSGMPGHGHFHAADCRNPEEWKKYLRRVLEVTTRVKPLPPGSPLLNYFR